MAVAVIDGCEKLNLCGENYKLLLLCICEDELDSNVVAESLSIEL